MLGNEAVANDGSRGIRELEEGAEPLGEERERVRRPGAGRKKLEDKDPELLIALEILIEPLTRGDPESPLRWTCKSSANALAPSSRALWTSVSAHRTFARCSASTATASRPRSKTARGRGQHPDRNAQFEHINRTVKDFQRRGQPVISVDTKKKELVGDFKNGGREWREEGNPDQVRVHDFKDPKLGKAIPYGVFDLAANDGLVSVGVDHDTPAFAVATIRRWWTEHGRLSLSKGDRTPRHR